MNHSAHPISPFKKIFKNVADCGLERKAIEQVHQGNELGTTKHDDELEGE